MNALIGSAILGVIMIFSSFLLNPVTPSSKKAVRSLAIGSLILLLVLNIMEMSGTLLFHIDSKGMINADKFALLFNCIAIGCTLIYFLLSGRDMENVGVNLSEYFALIFFILSGIFLSCAFKSF